MFKHRVWLYKKAWKVRCNINDLATTLELSTLTITPTMQFIRLSSRHHKSFTYSEADLEGGVRDVRPP